MSGNGDEMDTSWYSACPIFLGCECAMWKWDADFHSGLWLDLMENYYCEIKMSIVQSRSWAFFSIWAKYSGKIIADQIQICSRKSKLHSSAQIACIFCTFLHLRWVAVPMLEFWYGTHDALRIFALTLQRRRYLLFFYITITFKMTIRMVI